MAEAVVVVAVTEVVGVGMVEAVVVAVTVAIEVAGLVDYAMAVVEQPKFGFRLMKLAGTQTQAGSRLFRLAEQEGTPLFESRLTSQMSAFPMQTLLV